MAALRQKQPFVGIGIRPEERRERTEILRQHGIRRDNRDPNRLLRYAALPETQAGQ
jgi:hypothetical protein